MTNSPTLREYLAEVKLQFGFLEEEFGFTEIPNDPNENPFLIKFLKYPVQVGVEGVSWGVGVQVMLLNLANNDHKGSRIPLWAVERLRGTDPDEEISGQLQQLAIASKVLRGCASDILKGDFSVFPEAYELMMEIHNEDKTPRRKLP
jgi:hypothetical protein